MSGYGALRRSHGRAECTDVCLTQPANRYFYSEMGVNRIELILDIKLGELIMTLVRRSKNSENKPDEAKHRFIDKLLMLVFFSVFALGMSGFFIIDVGWLSNQIGKSLVEHVSTALIVTSILGIFYEFLFSRLRDERLRSLLAEHQLAMSNVVNAYDMLITPKQVFDLIQDIVSQTPKLPTLYSPARAEGNECSFAGSIQYFDSIVAQRPKEVESILQSWILPTSPSNLKFLASDLIGKYRLKPLAEELKRIAYLQFSKGILQSNNDDFDTSWVLNYLWAWSRCEQPMYKTMGDLLISTDNRDTREWILFVPRQMPDTEWCNILERYLHRHKITMDNAEDVARALAALKLAGHELDQNILKDALKNSEDIEEVREVVISIWREMGLDAEQL